MQYLQTVRVACLLGLFLFVPGCGAEAPPPTIGQPTNGNLAVGSVVSPVQEEFVGKPLELARALDYFGAAFDPEIWLQDQSETDSAGLLTTYAKLGESVTAGAFEEFSKGRTLLLIEKQQSNHMVIVTVLEWHAQAAAKRFVGIERLAMQAKDGGPNVEDVAYREVDESGFEGFIARKRLRDMFGPYPTRSAVVSRDKTVIEVTLLAEGKTDVELLDYIRVISASLGISAP